MAEFKDNIIPKENTPIKKGVSFGELGSNDSVALYQRLGPQFGVSVTILKKEGEEYTHDRTNPKTNRPESRRDLVPEGKSYINIASGRNDIGDFWKAVEAERQSQDNSSNPPKI